MNRWNKYIRGTYKIAEDGGLIINGSFDLNMSNLPIPKINYISGSFSYSFGASLSNLIGLPDRIGGDLIIRYNDLLSLKGCPSEVAGDCIIQGNLFTTLEYSPRIIGGVFKCSHNRLTSLKNSPLSARSLDFSTNNIREIYDIIKCDGDVTLEQNPVQILIFRFIKRDDNWDWIEFFNDCDIIRDDHIIWDRLVFFYDYLDISVDEYWEKDIENYYKIIK